MPRLRRRQPLCRDELRWAFRMGEVQFSRLALPPLFRLGHRAAGSFCGIIPDLGLPLFIESSQTPGFGRLPEIPDRLTIFEFRPLPDCFATVARIFEQTAEYFCVSCQDTAGAAGHGAAGAGTSSATADAAAPVPADAVAAAAHVHTRLGPSGTGVLWTVSLD